MREGTTLVDALQIAMLRFLYDDRKEFYISLAEKNEVYQLMKSLISSASFSNDELFAAVTSSMEKIQSLRFSQRIKSVLDQHNANAFAQHDLTIFQLGPRDTRKNTEAYLYNLWRKPEGVKPGSIGVKRILKVNENPQKHLHRWLIKSGYDSEVYSAKKLREKQEKFPGFPDGKEREIYPVEHITSKMFPHFTTLEMFLFQREKFLHDDNQYQYNLLDYKFKHSNPMKTDPVGRGTFFNKPVIGLVECYLLAYFYNKFDLSPNNIGFSNYADYIKFELIDFDGYSLEPIIKIKQNIEHYLWNKNFSEIRRCFSISLNYRLEVMLNDCVTDQMIEKEATALLNKINRKATTSPVSFTMNKSTNVFSLFELLSDTSIWRWREVFAAYVPLFDRTTDLSERRAEFINWCKKAINYMAFFPSAQAEFLLQLQKHPALNRFDKDSKKIVRTPFGLEIDALLLSVTGIDVRHCGPLLKTAKL